MQENKKKNERNSTSFSSQHFFCSKTKVIIRKIRQVRAMQESLFIDQSNLVGSKRGREKRGRKKKGKRE